MYDKTMSHQLVNESVILYIGNIAKLHSSFLQLHSIQLFLVWIRFICTHICDTYTHTYINKSTFGSFLINKLPWFRSLLHIYLFWGKTIEKTIHRYLQYKNVHVRAVVYIYYALEVGTTCLSGWNPEKIFCWSGECIMQTRPDQLAFCSHCSSLLDYRLFPLVGINSVYNKYNM